MAVRPRSSNGSSSSGGSSSGNGAKGSVAGNGLAPPPETLVFQSSGINLFVAGSADRHGGTTYRIGPQITPSIPFSGATCPVYEPTTDCVLFVVNRTAILQLDSSNGIRLLAGNRYTGRGHGAGDGCGAAARFLSISALAPDGLGSVYVADGHHIRKLDLASRQVETLPDSWPEGDGPWVGLSYDAAAHVLFAATHTAVCLVGKPLSGGNASSSRAKNNGDNKAAWWSSSRAGKSSGSLLVGRRARRRGVFVHLLAGDWAAAGAADGAGAAARFSKITSLLAAADRQLFILDAGALRIMDADCFLSTAVMPAVDAEANVTCLCVMPDSSLAVSSGDISMIRGQPRPEPSTPALGGRFVSRWPRPLQPSPAAAELHKVLTSAPARTPVASAGSDGAAAAVASSSSSSSSSSSDGKGVAGAVPHFVTVTAGGDARFEVHRYVLRGRSEYFQRLLDPESGFTDSGTTAVCMPDADPDALAWLLTYLYTDELFVPGELLWPAAALAGRLLLPASCTERLQEWLLAAVTPATVLSDLMWAEQYGMDELALHLKAFLLRNRRDVEMGAVGELLDRHPDLATELLRELAAGP